MNPPSWHIAKSHRMLAQARHMLNGDFADSAGRDAYLVAFHAALAYAVALTGKEPKTHSGTRTEYSRLAVGEASLAREFSTFLGQGFNYKMSADYDGGRPLTHADAEHAIATASSMVDAIAAALPPD